MEVAPLNYDSRNPELGQRILQVLGGRAPLKLLRGGECLRPERYSHGDAHPSMDYNPGKGCLCCVCGFKAGLQELAQLGIALKDNACIARRSQAKPVN